MSNVMEKCNQRIIAGAEKTFCIRESGHMGKCVPDYSIYITKLKDDLLNDITPMHKRIQLFLKKLKSQNTKSKKLRDTLQTVQSKINAIEEQIKK